MKNSGPALEHKTLSYSRVSQQARQIRPKMEGVHDWLLYCTASARRFTMRYLSYAQAHAHDLEALDRELANFHAARDWLIAQNDYESAGQLVGLIKAVSEHLRYRALNGELLTYCRGGLLACERLQINSGWLLLLQYEAHSVLGDWASALAEARAAIEASQNVDPFNHARAVLALGRLQLNLGEYRKAFNSLIQAEKLLTDLQDFEGVAATKSEVAAYYLNRGELDKAHELYLEVDRLQRHAGATETSNLVLFMLGVVHRKKENYPSALEFLQELLSRGESRNDPNAIAGASHHLAWVYLNQGNLTKAYQLAKRARKLYNKANNPRGTSDVDEQLGLIALAQGDTRAALSYIELSLTVRRQLGNQHGAASSLRRLAMVYFHQWNLPAAIFYLWRSLFLYWRLGVLSSHRILRTWRELWQWTVGRKEWTT